MHDWKHGLRFKLIVGALAIAGISAATITIAQFDYNSVEGAADEAARQFLDAAAPLPVVPSNGSACTKIVGRSGTAQFSTPSNSVMQDCINWQLKKDFQRHQKGFEKDTKQSIAAWVNQIASSRYINGTTNGSTVSVQMGKNHPIVSVASVIGTVDSGKKYADYLVTFRPIWHTNKFAIKIKLKCKVPGVPLIDDDDVCPDPRADLTDPVFTTDSATSSTLTMRYTFKTRKFDIVSASVGDISPGFPARICADSAVLTDTVCFSSRVVNSAIAKHLKTYLNATFNDLEK